MTIRYTREHEWVRIDDDSATVGISNYAQEQLGDVVFVELPDEGKELKKGEEMAVVESVKAASEVYAPVGGTVVATNPVLSDAPETVNSGAEGDGWFVKLKIADAAELGDLMDEAAYAAFLETI